MEVQPIKAEAAPENAGPGRSARSPRYVPGPWEPPGQEEGLLTPTVAARKLAYYLVLLEPLDWGVGLLLLLHLGVLLAAWWGILRWELFWLTWGLFLFEGVSLVWTPLLSYKVAADLSCLSLTTLTSRIWSYQKLWGAIGVLVRGAFCAAVWALTFIQRDSGNGPLQDRLSVNGDFVTALNFYSSRVDDLLLATASAVSLKVLTGLGVVFLTWKLSRKVPLQEGGGGEEPAGGQQQSSRHLAEGSAFAWYVHLRRHPSLMGALAQQNAKCCGLPLQWFHSVQELREVAAGQGGKGRRGNVTQEQALEGLIQQALQGRSQKQAVMEEGGLTLLHNSLVTGTTEVQRLAACLISAVTSDVLLIKYSHVDLMPFIPPLKTLAANPPTPQAGEAATGALLNIVRSCETNPNPKPNPTLSPRVDPPNPMDFHSVSSAVAERDLLHGGSGFEVFLGLASRGLTPLTQANALALLALMVHYPETRGEVMREAGFFVRVVKFGQHPEVRAAAAGVLWNLAYYDSLLVAKSEDCIPSLVSLLSFPQGQRAAAGALGCLALGTPSNRGAILAAPGALPSLVGLLLGSRGWPFGRLAAGSNAQELAALALANLAEDSEEAQRKILREPGAVSGLVSLLTSANTGASAEAAARALGNLAEYNHEGKTRVASEPGALSALVGLLQQPSGGLGPGLAAQEEAALALGNLAAGNPSNQQAIASEPGALAGLVRLLVWPRGEFARSASEWAAYALANLAAGNAENKVKIGAEPGAVAGLVAILQEGGNFSTEAQEYAVGALANLAAGNAENKVIIGREAGAISALVGLLRPGSGPSSGAQEDAVLALGNLAADNEANKVSIRMEPGALTSLVAILQGYQGPSVLTSPSSSKSSPPSTPTETAALPTSEALEWAAYALATLASGDPENQQALLREPGAVSALTRLLKGPTGGFTAKAQRWAAHALANLADGDRNGVLLREPGVIPRLVALLEPSPHLQAATPEDAARALGNLARQRAANKAAIAAEDGAILRLLALLNPDSEASVAAMEAATWAVGNLAAGSAQNKVLIAAHSGAIRTLVSLLHTCPTLKQNAALALGNLAAGNPDNQRAIVAEPRALQGLVALLSPNASLKAREWAAYALGNLAASNTSNKIIIAAEPGALKGLIRLLGVGGGPTAGAQEEAVLALGNLTAGNAANKSAVLFEQGAVGGLAELLRGAEAGATSRAQEYAAGVLRILASAKVPEKMGVFESTGALPTLQRLVSPKGSLDASPEAREQAGRALKALQEPISASPGRSFFSRTSIASSRLRPVQTRLPTSPGSSPLEHADRSWASTPTALSRQSSGDGLYDVNDPAMPSTSSGQAGATSELIEGAELLGLETARSVPAGFEASVKDSKLHRRSASLEGGLRESQEEKTSPVEVAEPQEPARTSGRALSLGAVEGESLAARLEEVRAAEAAAQEAEARLRVSSEAQAQSTRALAPSVEKTLLEGQFTEGTSQSSATSGASRQTSATRGQSPGRSRTRVVESVRSQPRGRSPSPQRQPVGRYQRQASPARATRQGVGRTPSPARR